MNELLSAEEQKVFDIWYAECDEHRKYYECFCRQQEKIMLREHSEPRGWGKGVSVKERRFYFVSPWKWVGGVASLLLLVTVGMLFWQDNRSKDSGKDYLENQVFHGSKNVILSLGEGQEIVIDSAFSERSFQSDCVQLKVETGILRYGRSSVADKKNVYNELIVPLSGEYVVELSDRTKIYLNSGSRLRYPVSFVGMEERRVFLEGEAYFIVFGDKQPFIVETLQEEVKVYGTEFNVMAYEDEGVLQTTLVKGSVGINVKGMEKGDFYKIVAGEQFCLDKQSGEVKINSVEVFPYIAWKDGLFVSQYDDLESIMRKISRWYDVDVFYQNSNLKKKRFFGIMKRQARLEEVLEIIAEAGEIRFSVNERVVTVTE